MQHCSNLGCPLGVIQQLCGPNFTKFWPPTPLEYTFYILHTVSRDQAWTLYNWPPTYLFLSTWLLNDPWPNSDKMLSWFINKYQKYGWGHCGWDSSQGRGVHAQSSTVSDIFILVQEKTVSMIVSCRWIVGIIYLSRFEPWYLDHGGWPVCLSF